MRAIRTGIHVHIQDPLLSGLCSSPPFFPVLAVLETSFSGCCEACGTELAAQKTHIQSHLYYGGHMYWAYLCCPRGLQRLVDAGQALTVPELLIFLRHSLQPHSPIQDSFLCCTPGHAVHVPKAARKQEKKLQPIFGKPALRWHQSDGDPSICPRAALHCKDVYPPEDPGSWCAEHGRAHHGGRCN